jgi:hypothetical protein
VGKRNGVPSSEDYTLIWVGHYRRVRNLREDDDAPMSPLEAHARRARLQVWHDTFEIDPVTGDVPCLLVGKQIGLLGYKEGRTKLSLDGRAIAAALHAVGKGLRTIGIRTPPRLHVLVHIEDVD